jgi:hypothetical protein
VIPARRARGCLVAVAAALALPTGLVALAGPASSSGPAPAAAPCLTRTDQHVPAPRRFRDTTPVRAADFAAVPTDVGSSTWLRLRAGARVDGPPLAAVVTIPVYVHVIKGTHRGERVPAGPKRVKRLIQILNGGFAGRQSSLAPTTRYVFRLKHINYTKRDGWFHAYLFGPRDERAKQQLHRGGKRTLNLYINGGGPHGQPILGWSRFPWQVENTPRLDGVTVNMAALPGGSARRYNLGDTVIHETGHWMGLLHTFQGGCTKPGDQVSDTPAEGRPSYYCTTTADTCPTIPGTDPVRNFMDYSWDTCMNTFSPNQVVRMDWAFARYRR